MTFVRAVLLAWLALVGCAAAWGGTPVRLGVLAFQGKEKALAQWAATTAYLGERLPWADVSLVPLTYDELNTEVRQGSVDLVLTNPEHYVALRNAYNLRPIVTVTSVVAGQQTDTFGSAIFTLSSRTDLASLADVRHRRVSAVGLYSLGGFLAAADSFREAGIDLRSTDVQELRFTGVPHSRVVDDVLAGRADVGIVRTGVLESLARDGRLNLSDVRVIKAPLSPDFPELNSTRLYPEWPLAALARVPSEVVKDVGMALLTLPPDSPAALAAGIHGFNPPANYAPVEALMQRLKVYPRVASVPLWTELWAEYDAELQWAGGLAVAALLGLLGHLWHSNRRLSQLTRLNAQAQEGLQVTAAAFNSQVGLVVADTDQRIIRSNQAMCDLLGVPEAELMGQPIASLKWRTDRPVDLTCALDLIRDHGHWQGEMVCTHRDGHQVPCTVTITSVEAGPDGLNGFVASFVDLTAQKQTEHDIRQLAFYDVLTQLPNRRLFLETLTGDMARCLAAGTLGSVMFIDLDHFKVLNDAHGHFVGDQLLRQIALRLQLDVGEHDMVARLGGDEFVVMLTSLASVDEQAASMALGVAESIRRNLLMPYTLHAQGEAAVGGPRTDWSYQCSCSIGVALYGQREEDLTEVLKRADVAMYQAKLAGRNAVRLYDSQAQMAASRQAAMTADLSTALARKELSLHYQLQCTAEGTPVGAECLLRWSHPVRGPVPPADFIALAEESGAIVAIGEWVLESACATLARWASVPSMAHMTLSVNVSPRQFNEADFLPRLLAILNQTGASPARLVLEVTEGIVLNRIEAVIEKMHLLRALGVGFSIDDFGTGYSSLSYLHRLPLCEVKIDKAFVSDMSHNPHSVAIVRSIIALGNSLRLKVVSEGVEDPAQKQLLGVMGCDVLQGYLLGKPVPLESFELALL